MDLRILVSLKKILILKKKYSGSEKIMIGNVQNSKEIVKTEQKCQNFSPAALKAMQTIIFHHQFSKKCRPKGGEFFW